jgi:hypothetical protein
MTASYSAILLVPLSDSKAKLRRAAYLYLTPVGDVMKQYVWHPDEAVRAVGCDEAGAGLVFLFHVYLVIAREAVEEGHDFASGCAIDYFVDPW